MDLPASLPACVYLLAVNPANNRLASRSMLGKALRAAALEQLAHEGRLVDRNGRPQATGSRVDDAFLESVLAAVRNSKPRKWTHWVGRDERRACRAVEEQVIAAGLATVDAHRVLGLIPRARVKVRDDRATRDLRNRTTRALTGTEPVSRLEPELAALAAIGALAALPTVADRRTRRRARGRLKELLQHGSPALTALKRSIDDAQAAAAAG